MEFNEKAEQILKYLDKNYYIKDKKFFEKYNDEHEWGYTILELITTIFSFEREFCDNILKNWIYAKDISEEELEVAWGQRKLKATWSPELAQDLQAYCITLANGEAELTRVLSQEIANEIDAQILRDIQILGFDNLVDVIKCVGYELGPVIYDPTNFVPKRNFVSMKYNDVIRERENNDIWKSWVRARKSD